MSLDCLALVMTGTDLHRFKGAYCTVLEKEPLQQLFGEMDVIEDTLPAMAENIVAAELND